MHHGSRDQPFSTSHATLLILVSFLKPSNEGRPWVVLETQQESQVAYQCAVATSKVLVQCVLTDGVAVELERCTIAKTVRAPLLL